MGWHCLHKLSLVAGQVQCQIQDGFPVFGHRNADALRLFNLPTSIDELVKQVRAPLDEFGVPLGDADIRAGKGPVTITLTHPILLANIGKDGIC